MSKQELLNTIDRLYALLITFPRLQKELLNIYCEVSDWCEKNDDAEVSMTLEEMQNDPLNSVISDAIELKWELEHFIISMDELEKIMLKMYN